MLGSIIFVSMIIITVLWGVIFFSAKYLITAKGRWGLILGAFIVGVATILLISYSFGVMALLLPILEPRTLVVLFSAALFQIAVSITMLISFHKRATEAERTQKLYSYTFPEKPSEINATKRKNPLFSIEIIAAIIQAAATLIAAWITLAK